MIEKQSEEIPSILEATAYREFCYRWTCSCGHENRVGEIVAGKSNVCGGCAKAAKISTIVYDNGCVGRIG